MNKPGDYLKLFEWWKEELSDIEKYILNHSYKPMGGYNDDLEVERVFQNFKEIGYEFSSADPVSQLCSFVDYVKDFDLKFKILNKAEEICENFSYASRHFLYLSFIKFHGAKRAIDPGSNALYYEYCDKMIAIADNVKKEMLQDCPTLPSHLGYEGFFERLVNMGKYKEAIGLVINAREKGWNISYLIDECWDIIEEHNLDPKEFGLKDTNEYYSQAEIDNNPYLKISLLLEQMNEKANSHQSFENEANEVLIILDKNDFRNYVTLETLFNIGILFYKNDEKVKGLETLNKIKTSIQDISPITISNFYRDIGKLLYSKGDYEIALQWLKNGLELNKKLSVKKLVKQIERKIFHQS
jgi:tetratricopeptide (TPR) repeat protein